MSNPKYKQEFKDRILREHLEEGRTLASLSKEYDLSRATINYWLKKYREECKNNPNFEDKATIYEENRRLRKALAEKEKENEFLKKAAAFFARETE